MDCVHLPSPDSASLGGSVFGMLLLLYRGMEKGRIIFSSRTGDYIVCYSSIETLFWYHHLALGIKKYMRQHFPKDIIMCEPEPDAARGVLSFLDVDQLFSSNYYGDSRQHDIEICHEQYVRENPYHPSYCNVENDEVIAHALQEAWSELSIADGAPSSHADEQYLQASTGVQHWHGPPREYYAGHDTGLEADDVGPSSSCSSPGDRSCDGEEYTTLEIQDEFEIDGEVKKRINQLSAIPHVPRINGDIPSVDEATSDHQRLLDRLQLFDLVEHKVQGDGNCQFRALSDQFYRSPEHHKFVRQQVVSQLKDHPEIYEGYVPMAYDEYLKRMAKNGEWGDHVTLQAAGDSYGVKILVITSFKDTCYIEILPKNQKSNRVIYLSFWAEVHYNSIYPQGDFPCDDFKKKKKKWSFSWHKH